MNDYSTEINEYTLQPLPCLFLANVAKVETEILNPERHREFSVFSKEIEEKLIQTFNKKIMAVKNTNLCPFFLLIVLHTATNKYFLSEKKIPSRIFNFSTKRITLVLKSLILLGINIRTKNKVFVSVCFVKL